MSIRTPRITDIKRPGSGPNIPLHSDPVLASIGATLTIEARFWSKVKITDSCWIWEGGTSGGRYGSILLGKNGERRIKAHILSWILENNRLPPAGMSVCHNCPGGDNTLCVNPAHLWIGTRQDNMDDRKAKRGTPKQPNQFRDGFGNRIEACK